MEAEASPEILEHLKDALHFLDVGGVMVKQKGIIGLLRRLLTIFVTITPVLHCLGVYEQPKEHFASELATLFSTSWAGVITSLMLYQWFRTKDTIICAMSRVLDKQLMIGEIDENVQKRIAKETKVRRFVSYQFYYLIEIIVSSGFIGWIIIFEMQTAKMEFNEEVAASIPLMFPLWFPIYMKKSKTMYIFCSIISSLLYLIIGINLVGALALFYAISTFGTINLITLNGFIETLYKRVSRNTKLDNRKEFEKRAEEELQKCILYLEEILSYCELVEKVYSTILLIQTAFSSTAVAGSVLMLLFKNPSTDGRYIAHAFIFVGCLEQTFIFCHFGNRLTEEADNVRKSLYFINWIDLNPRFKKTILLMMTRMTKPVTITMGKFAPLGLNIFIQIIKAAYSFVAVARNSNLAKSNA